MTDLPPLPVLAALLRIDLDDPDDRDDVAALADLLVRRELHALRDELPPPPRAYTARGDPRGRLGGMSTPMPGQYALGEAYPDPAAADGPTRWGAPVRDAVESADGAAPWADVSEPAAVPPPVAGDEGPHTRAGGRAHR